MNIGDVCQILGQVAPLHLAQEWDNVGLLAGDEAADCASILLTIDLTPEVLDEAVRHKVALIMAYHPPLFKPISSLRAGSLETDSLVWRAIRAGIAIYSMHTALDAADGGTCDVLAKICGAVQLQPFEYVDDAKRKCKIVVFVPPDHADRVAEAMSAAGAGIIGQYTRCSFRIPGTGTFLGSQTSNPAIGKAGRYETVAEIRLEMVVPQEAIPAVVSAVRNSHPYEEPAFDIYPLQPRTVGGIGRIGILPEPVSVTALLADLKKKTPTTTPVIVGDFAAQIQRVLVLPGSAGRWPLKCAPGPTDCIVTGDIRHHDARMLERIGIHAVALGHWASERPVLEPLSKRLQDLLPDTKIHVSKEDRDPFRGDRV